MPVPPFLFFKKINLPLTLAALFFICVLSAVVVPRSLTFMPSLVGVIGTFILWAQTKKFPTPPKTDLFFIGGICALGCLSAFWAPNFEYCLGQGYKIVQILIPGLLLIDIIRRIDLSVYSRFPLYLSAPFIIGGVLMGFEHLNGFPILQMATDRLAGDPSLNNKYNRAEVFVGLSYLPLCFMIWHSEISERIKKISLFILTACVLFSMSQTNSQTAQLGFLTTLIAFFIWPKNKKFIWVGTAIIFSLVVLFMPFIAIAFYNFVPDTLNDESILRIASIPHRLEIWHFIANEALKHPFIGNGIEATRFLFSPEPLHYMRASNVLHPHNSILQIWVEFGLLGITLSTAFILYVMKSIWNAPIAARKISMAVLLACIAISLTGFGFWQGYQLGLFIYATGLVMLLRFYAVKP